VLLIFILVSPYQYILSDGRGFGHRQLDILQEYFRLQFDRGNLSSYIFGHIYASAPMVGIYLSCFFATTPAFVLIFFFLGSVYSNPEGSSWDRMILVKRVVSHCIFSHYQEIYRYDWVRLILASFPFVCLLAGRGMTVAIQWFPP